MAGFCCLYPTREHLVDYLKRIWKDSINAMATQLFEMMENLNFYGICDLSLKLEKPGDFKCVKSYANRPSYFYIASHIPMLCSIDPGCTTTEKIRTHSVLDLFPLNY